MYSNINMMGLLFIRIEKDIGFLFLKDITYLHLSLEIFQKQIIVLNMG